MSHDHDERAAALADQVLTVLESILAGRQRVVIRNVSDGRGGSVHSLELEDVRAEKPERDFALASTETRAAPCDVCGKPGHFRSFEAPRPSDPDFLVATPRDISLCREHAIGKGYVEEPAERGGPYVALSLLASDPMTCQACGQPATRLDRDNFALCDEHTAEDIPL